METYFTWMLRSLLPIPRSTMTNRLYYADNLAILKEMPAEEVDLVYLDPPFNSNASYNAYSRRRPASSRRRRSRPSRIPGIGSRRSEPSMR